MARVCHVPHRRMESRPWVRRQAREVLRLLLAMDLVAPCLSAWARIPELYGLLLCSTRHVQRWARCMLCHAMQPETKEIGRTAQSTTYRARQHLWFQTRTLQDIKPQLELVWRHCVTKPRVQVLYVILRATYLDLFQCSVWRRGHLDSHRHLNHRGCHLHLDRCLVALLEEMLYQSGVATLGHRVCRHRRREQLAALTKALTRSRISGRESHDLPL